ncbi:hypothetical protein M3B90_01900 [Dermabacter sp. p3-SID358]|uniref:hypothetical protein n=1 Tax=Dermabacter sp. p3-SID358 TaxID=2916114 RepID=UPI0021A2E232|nr:hypothetical protein [Dermabacter sp. p3-SID358]MCT1866287.1 hypothetical protein [Dermabacter sp. p3-SID358]
MEVFCVDDGVERLIAAALEAAGLDEPWEDAVLELSDNDQVVDNYVALFRLLRVHLHQVREPAVFFTGDVIDEPQPVITYGRRAAWFENAYLATAFGCDTGEFDGFWLVAFKNESEVTPTGESSNLALEVGPELWIYCVELTHEVSESRHSRSPRRLWP